jgi:hypothetical protein
MLSFNKNKGRAIGIIKGGRYNKKNIYFNDKGKGKLTGKNEIIINDGVILPLPNKNVVEKIYISAPSGAGKTTFISKWIKEYKKMFKDDEIYIISSIDYDKPLDDLDPIRININDDLINDDMLDGEDFYNSCVVFDDVDTIQNNNYRHYIEKLRDYLLEQGRHYNVRMLMTHHLLSNYKKTRIMINECTACVLFPKVNGNNIKRFLEFYFGFDKNQIEKIKNLPSRWVAIYKTYPHYIMHSKGCYIVE